MKKNKNSLYVIVVLLIVIIALLILCIYNKNKTTKTIEPSKQVEKKENTSIKHESKEFFQKYLEPFQTCNGTLLVNKDNYEDQYNIFVAMYYMVNYMDKNASEYKETISKEDIKNLLYKYFGDNNSSIEEYKNDSGLGVTKVDEDHYEIYWGAHGCGNSIYEIDNVSYNGNNVTVNFNRYSYNLDDKILDGKKTFTLKYEDNNYRVKKIEYEEIKN